MKNNFAIRLPKRSIVNTLEPKKIWKIRAPFLVEKSLENSINSLNFIEFISNYKSILIVVNDSTRSTPTERILSIILPKMYKNEYKIIIATGTHKINIQKDFPRIFGKLSEKIQNSVIIHNSKEDEMIFFGSTSFNNKIYLNKCIDNFEGIITIGSVEPHYFAGFTGGRKSFLPGIASYQTIEKNHSFALDDENSKIAHLSGNPVHEDMIEAVSLINKPIYSIQTVFDTDQNVIFSSAGHINDSFNTVVDFSREIFIKKVPSYADIIIAEIEFPFDQSLYQAHKGLENCKSVLKKGGIFILVANCKEGFGSSNFVNLLLSSKSLDELTPATKNEYKLGYHKTYRIAKFLQHNSLWLVSNLPDSKVSEIFMKNHPSIQSAIDSAIKIKGEDVKILIVKNAATLIPTLSKKFDN